MIRLHDVRYAYPGGAALRVPDLAIGAGLTLVLGPNGAGKSTLLRLVAGVERPDSGRILLAGHDLWRDEVAARRALAYVAEQPELTPYATVGEVLDLVCALRGAPRADGERALAEVGLAELGGRTVRELSMGQRRRAMLAAALVGRAAVLVLDEPLETMDRAMRAMIVAWARERAAAGAAVLVATHAIDPFVPLAARAIGVAGQGVTLVPELPAEPAARRELLERMARGDAGAHPGA